MKKLFLHIGSSKTGTSSIQGVFHNNRDGLHRQGFWYPGNEINHHKLFFATNSAEENWPRQFKGIDKQVLNESVNNFFSLLEKDFQSDINNQIISTESFFFGDKEMVQNVFEYLDSFFSEIKVFVFVRDPVSFYRSRQQQIIKARSWIESPSGYYYNFKEVVEAWSQFCEPNVIKYSSERDSCEVFCNLIGIDFKQLSQSKQRSNSSLSIEQMVFLEKIQKNLYRNLEDRFKYHLNVLQRIDAPFTSRPKLKNWVKASILQSHKMDLGWLKEEYGIEFGSEISVNKNFIDENINTINSERASVRDTYHVNEETVERYEALCIDALLKKLVNG